MVIFIGVIVSAAFLAHAIQGAREMKQIKPPIGKPRQIWAQSLSGWHWVSVDLLLCSIAFLTIGLNDLPHEPFLLKGLALYFLLCGLAWLATVIVSGREVEKRFLVLGQWAFCFVVAGLSWFAATSAS